MDLDSALHGKAADGAGALEILRDDHPRADPDAHIAMPRARVGPCHARGWSGRSPRRAFSTVGSKDAVVLSGYGSRFPISSTAHVGYRPAIERIVGKPKISNGERDYADVAETLVGGCCRPCRRKRRAVPLVEQQMGRRDWELGAMLSNAKRS